VQPVAPPVAIRHARPDELPAAAALLARSLRFNDADAVPAWLIRTTDECGGLTLVATSRGTLVAASYAFPAFVDGAPFLFSCGLAVTPEYRGRQLGLQLKQAQRQEAIARGYSTIRWTTDPVNGRALRVYLSGLGAVVTGYRAKLHDGLRADPGHSQDDLDVVWDLVGTPRMDRDDIRRVELPWASPGRADRDRVRSEMSALLADGFVGAAVELDRAQHRCRVAFARMLA
jgi:predicted GNAT superfamily acetyltransferase